MLPCASLAVQCAPAEFCDMVNKASGLIYLFQLTMTRLLHFYANPTFLRCCRSVNPAWPETMHSGTVLLQTAVPYFQEVLFVVEKNKF